MSACTRCGSRGEVCERVNAVCWLFINRLCGICGWRVRREGGTIYGEIFRCVCVLEKDESSTRYCANSGQRLRCMAWRCGTSRFFKGKFRLLGVAASMRRVYVRVFWLETAEQSVTGWSIFAPGVPPTQTCLSVGMFFYFLTTPVSGGAVWEENVEILSHALPR